MPTYIIFKLSIHIKHHLPKLYLIMFYFIKVQVIICTEAIPDVWECNKALYFVEFIGNYDRFFFTEDHVISESAVVLFI